MSIAHGHGNGLVAQDALEDQDVTAVHHEVAGEGMPEDVSQLAGGRANPEILDGRLKGFVGIAEEATYCTTLAKLADQGRGNGNGTLLAGLGCLEGEATLADLPRA